VRPSPSPRDGGLRHPSGVVPTSAGLEPPGRAPTTYQAEAKVLYPQTIIPGQLAVKNWHTDIVGPAVGAAVLDRVVHNAHQIIPKGKSMRKKRSPLTNATESAKQLTLLAA